MTNITKFVCKVAHFKRLIDFISLNQNQNSVHFRDLLQLQPITEQSAMKTGSHYSISSCNTNPNVRA